MKIILTTIISIFIIPLSLAATVLYAGLTMLVDVMMRNETSGYLTIPMKTKKKHRAPSIAL